MINIRTLKKLKNNDGLTLKNGKVITYKSGYQVATSGIETPHIDVAMSYIKNISTITKSNCGIWYSNGIYYIDIGRRISTKKEAIEVGKAHNQISILKWNGMELIYL